MFQLAEIKLQAKCSNLQFCDNWSEADNLYLILFQKLLSFVMNLSFTNILWTLCLDKNKKKVIQSVQSLFIKLINPPISLKEDYICTQVQKETVDLVFNFSF